MPISAFSKAITIFFSYDTSTPKDKRMFEKIIAHLSLLRRQHLIDEWYDSAINAGGTIAQLIEEYLDPARIIVLLMSAEFFASDRCYDIEMKRALELYDRGDAQLIPVILFPFDGTLSPLEGHTPLPPNGKPVSEWKNRDRAFSEVAKGIRQVVEEVAKMLGGRQPRTPSIKFPFQYIHYRENSFFTDRESILNTLSTFFPLNKNNQTTILILNGLGGIGKTQIAREYFKRTAERYQIRLWLNASSRDILSTEVSILTEKLGLSKIEDEKEQDHFTLLKNWLKAQTLWLLVLDHLNDMVLLKEIVPIESQGHVLLTTRTREVEDSASVLPIERMSNEAGTLFLLHRAGMLRQEKTLEEASTELREQAKEIVQLLDGFPLAIDQAGAYIEEMHCSLESYLSLYQRGKLELLGRRGKSNEHHPDSVAITLLLTIEQVSKIRSINLALLQLLAFLQPETIPIEMLEYGATELNKPLQTLAANAQKLQEAIGDLENFSLVQYCDDRTIVSIHRLVQALLTDSLSKSQQKKWAIQVIKMVNSVFPEVDFESWTECERYLPQAQHCAVLVNSYKISTKEAPLLLERLGNYCYRRGRYHDSETHLKTALSLHEEQHEIDFLKLAQTLNSLGLLTSQQGRDEEAEKYYLRALEIREQELEQDHPKMAESLHNLGMLYINRGEYEQAEQIYQRVRSIEERTIGNEDPDFAKTLNNLALIYYKQAHYELAEATYQQALMIYERTLSPEHPDWMHPLNGLGAIYEEQSEYERAEKLYKRALEIGEKTLGNKHIETAHNLNILANVYESQGKYAQAEEFYQRALHIGEEVLGPKHQTIALFLNNLAFLADQQGFYEQAEPLYLRALHISEQSLGKDHDMLASILDNLGQLHTHRGEYEQAEELLRRALTIRKQKLGEVHPDTVQSLKNLTENTAAWQKHKEMQEQD